jgi:hypothetical protein
MCSAVTAIRATSTDRANAPSRGRSHCDGREKRSSHSRLRHKSLAPPRFKATTLGRSRDPSRAAAPPIAPTSPPTPNRTSVSTDHDGAVRAATSSAGRLQGRRRSNSGFTPSPQRRHSRRPERALVDVRSGRAGAEPLRRQDIVDMEGARRDRFGLNRAVRLAADVRPA